MAPTLSSPAEPKSPRPSLQLDILACNTFGSGRTEGKILVNGAPRRAADFQRRSCYVQQRDVLLASSTVRESIMFSALLKLPRTLAYADKKARVDRILSELVSPPPARPPGRLLAHLRTHA